MYKAELEGFKKCCGIYIGHTFFKNPDPFENVYDYVVFKYGPYYANSDKKAGKLKDYEEEWKHFLKRCETLDQYKTRIRNQLTQWCSKKSAAYIVVVLNEKEREYAEDLLYEFGFEIAIQPTRNPNTSHEITMYVKFLLKDTQKVQSIF